MGKCEAFFCGAGKDIGRGLVRKIGGFSLMALRF
jgi:hypothetical protein